MGTIAVISFCSVLLLTFPAIIPRFDLSLSQTANIGNTIGGITGPIVGMFSAYLIYEALMAQQKGNKDQRVKADSDVIFLLFNQLDKEYDTLHIKLDQGQKEIHLYGYDALASKCHTFKKNKDRNDIFRIFRADLTTNRIIYMIRSFMMIRERVLFSKFSADIELMFIKKLEIYYESKFKYPIKHLLDTFGHLDNDLINELKEFKIVNSPPEPIQ